MTPPAPTSPNKPTLKQSLSDFTNSLNSLAQKINPKLGFIYFCLLLIGITFVVYLASKTMQSTDTGGSAATSQKVAEYSIPFDKKTITKIKSISTKNESPNISLPTGRINPFSESLY